MARVHLFTSQTPYNKRRSPSQEEFNHTEEPKISFPPPPPPPTTIDESTLDIDAVPASPSINSPRIDNNTNNNNSQLATNTNTTANDNSNNAALAAALLQNTHSSLDVVEAVAAALSVQPESLLKEVRKSSSDITSDEKQPEVVGEAIDKAAAVTALQLLGLSQTELKKEKDPSKESILESNDNIDNDNSSSSGSSNGNNNNNNAITNSSHTTTDLDSSNVMLIANYPGLSNHIDGIDLSSEDMIQDYKRGTWTREEDELLLAGIKKYGYGRWKEIANSIPGRKGKQLKQRWDNTLSSKYVDQDWLKSKIRNDQQQQMTKNPFDDKSIKFPETTDWDGIMQKITEKAKEGDQNGIEVLLSQALLGIVTGTSSASTSTSSSIQKNTTATATSTSPTNTSTPSLDTTTATTSDATTLPPPQPQPQPQTTTTTTTTASSSSLIPDSSQPSSPTKNMITAIQQDNNSSTVDSNNNNNSNSNSNNSNNSENIAFNFSRMVPNPPPLNFADATALAIYAQQLSQQNQQQQQQQQPESSTTSQSNNTTSTLAALANHPFFQCSPFNHSVTDNATAAAAAAAVAAVTAVAQQQQQQNQNQNHQQNQQNSTSDSLLHSSSSPVPRNNNLIPNSSNVAGGQKRRRSDPALADTQSAAMSIYASSSPITTTVNNQTQTVYPCLFPNCGKTFARLYNLKSHSRTHTDDRPFICHACQAAFSRNHDLKRHTKIHGGEKPYKCNGCNKSFSRLDALKRHKSNQRNKTACMSN